MFVQWIHTGYQDVSDSLFFQKSNVEDVESFSAYDEHDRLGIAWRENDNNEGTYLFMTHHVVDDYYSERGESVVLITQRKLESELRRIDEIIRQEAGQVSTVGLSE
jgi:hypothetical protein